MKNYPQIPSNRQIKKFFKKILFRKIYHHVSKDRLPEYLVEFQARFSRKEYFKSVDDFLLKTIELVTTG